MPLIDSACPLALHAESKIPIGFCSTCSTCSSSTHLQPGCKWPLHEVTGVPELLLQCLLLCLVQLDCNTNVVLNKVDT